VSEESLRKGAADRSQQLTDAHIQRLLRNADRLGFGIRPAGFVLINRSRLLAAKGISPAGGLLIDQWVARAGGGLQPLLRVKPEETRKDRQRATRPDTIVWGVPARALTHDAGPLTDA
jgi:branched-subunit amino acid aminotransferase/4-amino-4-deoxychorismate lyase